MGLGGYLTWTPAAREIRKRAGKNIFILPVEQHGSFIKIIDSEIFRHNDDFINLRGELTKNVFKDCYIFPLVLNNPDANYCKKDTPEKAFHRPDIHIIHQICECYGITNSELKCVLNLDYKERNFANDFHKCILNGERFITIEPFSKDNYTPNRRYPFEKWQKVVDCISDKIKVVQVGNSEKVLKNVTDLTNNTTFREAAAIIGKSELFLSTESGLVHAATAVETKSIVIHTGYADLRLTSYPQNINISISSHGPCGLKIRCDECTKDAIFHDEFLIVEKIMKELEL